MKPVRKRTSIILGILLALVCIATAELVVCRYADPELFHTITDPVVDTAAKAVSSITGAADDLAGRIRASIESYRLAQAEAKNPPPEPTDQTLPPPSTENQSATAPLYISSAPICDPSVTELQTANGQQVLTGGPVQVVYYHQCDTLWGDLNYGTDKISTHGCGPTAMAMVVASLTDTESDPFAMAEWAVRNGHWAKSSGSYHSIVISAAREFGLEAESFPKRDADALRDELLAGKLLVALMGPGHFTQSGHFIVLRGVTLSGDILVADPNSLELSLTGWDAQLILDELSKSTADGSPLWVISAPKTGVLE